MLSFVAFGLIAYTSLIVVVLCMCAAAKKADRVVVEDDLPYGELLVVPQLAPRISA